MNKNRKRSSKKTGVRAMALSMAAAMAVTLYPIPAFAGENGQAAEQVMDKTGGNVHDYGKTGDDPTTPDDESAIVANSDVLKSAQYQESTKYDLKVNGTPVSVYKYQKQQNPGKYYHMDIARFSSDDPEAECVITLKDGSTIESVEAYPERYYDKDAFTISADKKTVTFKMSAKLRYCIVNINGTIQDQNGKPQLAIVNDPTETEKPEVTAENVLNFKDFAEQYLKDHPITDKVGEKCRDAGSVTDKSLNNSTEYTWEYGEGVFQNYTDKQVTFPNKRVRLSNDVTEAFQAALEKVKNDKTLDTIYFPAGTYLWSGLSIKDWDGKQYGHLTIYTDEDALMVNRLQECQEAMEPAIGIWNSSDITISGRGIYDGQGTYNYETDRADANKSGHQGGCMVVQSQNITFNDTYVRDVKQWNWEVHTGKDITYNNIKGFTPYQHAWVDGLDLTSGKNITVNGSFTMGNDDTFASGHYNPSDGFPTSELSGKNLDNLSETSKNIAAAAGIYNKDRLEWDTDDSDNFELNNSLGWTTYANSVRLGHSTKWKNGGSESYEMRNYTFNNFNSVLIKGYAPNNGTVDALRIQNGNMGCNPNYQNLVFKDCSFAGNDGNNICAPTGDTYNFKPSITLDNCWFKDETKAFHLKSLKSLTINDLYVNGKLVEYTSQIVGNIDKNSIDKFTFTANGKDVMENTLPTITSPTGTIEAESGSELMFKVEATDPDEGDTVTYGDVDLSKVPGAEFDKETGVFRWTPSASCAGKKYYVTFTVYDRTGTAVTKKIKIQVSTAGSQMYDVTPTDTYLASWNNEKTENFEGKEYLRMRRMSQAIGNQDGYGLFGEKITDTADGKDAKVSVLQFDVTDLKSKLSGLEKAEVELTLINKRGGSGMDRLLAVPITTDYDASKVTWNTHPVWDSSQIIYSDEFSLDSKGNVNNTVPIADSSYDGTKVTLDVTDLVKKLDGNVLSLAVCEEKGNEIAFASTEGAAKLESEKDAAPVLRLRVKKDTRPEVEAGQVAVSEDAFVGSWDGDQSGVFGTKNFLRTSYSTDSKGVLGTGSASDNKVTYLKFDLSQLDMQELSSVKLQLSMLGVRYDDGKNKDMQLLVGVADNDDWKEDGLNWNNKPAVSTEETSLIASEEFNTGSVVSNDPALISTPNGTKVTADVTNFILAAKKAGKNSITFVVNVDGSNGLDNAQRMYFVSREGAKNLTNASEMAPKLILNKYEETPEQPTLTGITLTAPTKTVYEVGEKLDTTGMKVVAAYSDSTTKEVDLNDVTITGFDSSKVVAKQTVTVSYEGKEATFTVEIKNTALENAKTAAIEAINAKVEEVKKAVNALVNLTDEQKASYVTQVQGEATTAITSVKTAATAEAVTNIQTSTIGNMDKVLAAAKDVDQKAADEAALKSAKEEAVKDINTYADTQKAAIAALKGLSEEEITAYNKKAEDAKAVAIEKINAAADKDAVAKATTDGKTALDGIVKEATALSEKNLADAAAAEKLQKAKEAAVKAVNDKAASITAEIEKLTNLSADQKDAYKANITSAVKAAETEINAETTEEKVTETQKTAEKSLDNVLTEAKAADQKAAEDAAAEAALKAAKEAAVEEINTYADTQKAAIAALKGLSEEELAAYNQKAEDAKAAAIEKINAAADKDAVTKATTDGKTALDEVVTDATTLSEKNLADAAAAEKLQKAKEAAVKAVNDKAASITAEIEKLTNLSAEQKDAYKANVASAVKAAETEINAETTEEKVTETQKTAEKSLDNVLTEAKAADQKAAEDAAAEAALKAAKDAAIKDINDKAKASVDEINAMENLTDEQKDAYIKEVQKNAADAIEKINNADAADQVDSVKTDAIKANDSVKDAAKDADQKAEPKPDPTPEPKPEPEPKKNGLSEKPEVDGNMYYYRDGVVATDVNTIINNKEGWYYVRNGKVDFSFTGLSNNQNGWWRVENGKVNFNYNGITNNKIGWWKVTNGKVDFNYTGVSNNENGWWYVRNGKVDFSANTIANNQNGWWKIVNGKVDFNYTGVSNNQNGWWRVENGKVNFNFNGIANNQNGWWYIRDGKVDFSKNGYIKVQGKYYQVVNGKIRT